MTSIPQAPGAPKKEQKGMHSDSHREDISCFYKCPQKPQQNIKLSTENHYAFPVSWPQLFHNLNRMFIIVTMTMKVSLPRKGVVIWTQKTFP